MTLPGKLLIGVVFGGLLGWVAAAADVADKTVEAEPPAPQTAPPPPPPVGAAIRECADVCRHVGFGLYAGPAPDPARCLTQGAELLKACAAEDAPAEPAPRRAPLIPHDTRSFPPWSQPAANEDGGNGP